MCLEFDYRLANNQGLNALGSKSFKVGIKSIF